MTRVHRGVSGGIWSLELLCDQSSLLDEQSAEKLLPLRLEPRLDTPRGSDRADGPLVSTPYGLR